MAEYLHGAYGQINTLGADVANTASSAFVYVGFAPVHTVEGGSKNVNRPIVLNNIAEARKYLGYSDDWETFTLCEAMHTHLELVGVAPIICINTFDPAKHTTESDDKSVVLTPINGRVTITNAELIILDSVTVNGKTKGSDYSIAYNPVKKAITIAELSNGALGTSELSIKYKTVTTKDIATDELVGSTDNLGLNKGLYVINDVYTLTGYVPSFLVVPHYSGLKEVHELMRQICQKINGHWDAFMYTDLPLMDEDKDTELTIANANIYQKAHGFTKENEKVFFPCVSGVDGHIYHLSVLAAANLQSLLIAQDGIPYKSSSNTACDIIKSLYTLPADDNRVYDDKIINEYLCKNGITSAAYIGGKWVIWGPHCADYNQEDADYVNVFDTNRMMLYYVSNDFQRRRSGDVDRPMTRNDLAAIVSEEQARLDALINIGALTYGTVSIDATSTTQSDLINGDYSFTFNVTTTPLAKSLTAIVNWTDDGFATYFAETN